MTKLDEALEAMFTAYDKAQDARVALRLAERECARCRDVVAKLEASEPKERTFTQEEVDAKVAEAISLWGSKPNGDATNGGGSP